MLSNKIKEVKDKFSLVTVCLSQQRSTWEKGREAQWNEYKDMLTDGAEVPENRVFFHITNFLEES